jgi:hypothetical protein
VNRRVAWAGALLVLGLAGCSGSGSESVPTLTLIPATPTPTSTPAGPTATPQDLTSPEDLAATRPSPTEAQEASGDRLLDIDPVAADLAALAQRLLAEQLDLPVRRVRIVDVQAVVWLDSSLGCPQPDQMYSQVLIPGYRIVVEAAGEQVIFHTDFDRALPCSPEDERLPPGVVLAPDETAEATPES